MMVVGDENQDGIDQQTEDVCDLNVAGCLTVWLSSCLTVRLPN
jgi:hypothetical protein